MSMHEWLQETLNRLSEHLFDKVYLQGQKATRDFYLSIFNW